MGLRRLALQLRIQLTSLTARCLLFESYNLSALLLTQIN